MKLTFLPPVDLILSFMLIMLSWLFDWSHEYLNSHQLMNDNPFFFQFAAKIF